MHGSSLELESDESEDDIGATSSAFRSKSYNVTITNGLIKDDLQVINHQHHLHNNNSYHRSKHHQLHRDILDDSEDEDGENVDIGTIIVSMENEPIRANYQSSSGSSISDESIQDEQLTITSNGSKVSHGDSINTTEMNQISGIDGSNGGCCGGGETETSILLTKESNKRSKEINGVNNDSNSNNGSSNRSNHPHTISCRPLSESPSIAQLSMASSLISDPNAPMCKICHLNAKEMDPLITPCRCAGTMRYIHCGCLMRWLEISSKRTRKPLSCELCQYKYQWHKKFKVRQCQFPHCSRRDKILHTLFFFSVSIMIACAIMTVMCFKHDRGQRLDPNRTELTESEIITLICGVLFFLAFFMAMYVEVKAKNTLYKLLLKFIYLNQQWYIDEYEKKETRPVDI